MPKKTPYATRNRPQGLGRAHLNMVISPDLKLAAQIAARAEGVSLSLWVEDVLRDKLTVADRRGRQKAVASGA